MIGLIVKLQATTNSEVHALAIRNQSREGVQCREIQLDKLQVLKEIGELRSIPLILEAERVILDTELEYLRGTTEQGHSLRKAIHQLETALRSYEIVRNPEGYRQAASTYPEEETQNGLPLDAFRKFLKANVARLGNRRNNVNTDEENAVYQQRKANLTIALDEYRRLQRKALGIQDGEAD